MTEIIAPQPRYPIYIPSKNRADVCFTAGVFLRYGVDFKIVVEPGQYDAYKTVFGADQLLLLPEDDMKLLGARLWIREHAIAAGFDRHWQFDDNIRVVEDFTDRYENIGISGFNYTMFVMNQEQQPFYLNCHVYSACLINNRMPYKWRLIYNDDTDLCLQVLTNGLCTVSFNAFSVQKMPTMVLKGGNTEDLYKETGRLRMARTLEAMWPDWVTVKWRFGRPQHIIKNAWRDFTTPLIRRKDIDWDALQGTTNDYGLKLVKVKEIKSNSLKKLF